MVLEACPDIIDYAKQGITSWRDFVATAALVRSMLGISPSAFEDATTVLGVEDAAVVVAAILQRSEHDQEPWRLLAQSDGEGEGRGVLARTRAHGLDPHQFA